MDKINVRAPVTWLNYAGDVTSTALTCRPFYGPNAMGERLYPVSAVYDEETDLTRVGFTFIAPGAAGAVKA